MLTTVFSKQKLFENLIYGQKKHPKLKKQKKFFWFSKKNLEKDLLLLFFNRELVRAPTQSHQIIPI